MSTVYYQYIRPAVIIKSNSENYPTGDTIELFLLHQHLKPENNIYTVKNNALISNIYQPITLTKEIIMNLSESSNNTSHDLTIYDYVEELDEQAELSLFKITLNYNYDKKCDISTLYYPERVSDKSKLMLSHILTIYPTLRPETISFVVNNLDEYYSEIHEQIKKAVNIVLNYYNEEYNESVAFTDSIDIDDNFNKENILKLDDMLKNISLSKYHTIIIDLLELAANEKQIYAFTKKISTINFDTDTIMSLLDIINNNNNSNDEKFMLQLFTDCKKTNNIDAITNFYNALPQITTKSYSLFCVLYQYYPKITTIKYIGPNDLSYRENNNYFPYRIYFSFMHDDNFPHILEQIKLGKIYFGYFGNEIVIIIKSFLERFKSNIYTTESNTIKVYEDILSCPMSQYCYQSVAKLMVEQFCTNIEKSSLCYPGGNTVLHIIFKNRTMIVDHGRFPIPYINDIIKIYQEYDPHGINMLDTNKNTIAHLIYAGPYPTCLVETNINYNTLNSSNNSVADVYLNKLSKNSEPLPLNYEIIKNFIRMGAFPTIKLGDKAVFISFSEYFKNRPELHIKNWEIEGMQMNENKFLETEPFNARTNLITLTNDVRTQVITKQLYCDVTNKIKRNFNAEIDSAKSAIEKVKKSYDANFMTIWTCVAIGTIGIIGGIVFGGKK